MKKCLWIFVAICFANMFCFAQMPHQFTQNVNTPLWAQYLYSASPNAAQVIAEYKKYYATHDFIKNEHTQNYKHWLHSLRNNINTDTITAQTQSKANWAQYLQASKNLRMQKSATSAWSSVGPFDFDKESASRSYAAGAAHVYTVEQSISNPNVLYAGTANAGLWKTINKGNNWTPLTLYDAVGTVYALEIDYTNDMVMYYCDGSKILKTTNGGTTFTATGNAAFQASTHFCNDIKMNPTNNQNLIAATEQGLYSTIDGGLNWNLISSGIWQEVEWHTTNALLVYAIKQTSNKTEFYKSTDGGQTFTIRTPGWPVPAAADENKRTEIAITPAAPNIIYAFATGAANSGSGLYGIYVSHDAGENWQFNCCGTGPGGAPDPITNINLCGWADDGSDDGGQFYYDLALAVSPIDSNEVHTGAVNHWVSHDGGINFICTSKWSDVDNKAYVHADLHDINFFGNDLWLACDGGIFYSSSFGDTIVRKQYGIEGTDFWGFGVGYWDGDYTMVGGTYHNGTLIKHNNTYINGWVSAMGGDNILGAVNYGAENTIFTDYNRHQLTGNRTIDFIDLANALKPSSSYIVGEDAELEFDPANYNTVYIGNGNGFFKSTDGGANFTSLYTFATNETVGSIEIANDRTTFYCATFPGWWNAKKLYKSTDAGLSWTDITPANTMFNSANLWAGFDIAVGDNPNELWLVRMPMSTGYNNLDGYKVFKTNDGGTTWQNLTTPTLDGEYITNIVHKKGSNGGVYIGTSRAVYYKNNLLSDWQLFNNSLPVATSSTQLVINDKLGKIRNGTNRSVYECDLYENNFKPIAQISVDKTTSNCIRDTFYFVDHSSIYNNANTWHWSFPGGNPSTSTSRNPKVTYNASGTYNVSLVVTDAFGSDTQSYVNYISVNNQCLIDTIPGAALQLNGVDAEAYTAPLNLNTNTVTMGAWVKPNGSQNDWAGVLFCRGGSTTSGISIKSDNEVRYHWAGGKYGFSSGLYVIPNEWNYIAYVISPTQAMVYVNGVVAINTASHAVEAFDAPMAIGIDNNSTNRRFNGLIDEVAVYNRSLTLNELRELQHLTRKPTSDPSLILYYQFNEIGNQAIDKVGFNHASLNSTCSRVRSTAPLGGGTSATLTLTASGNYNFVSTKTELNLPSTGTFADGDVVVTRINLMPDTAPANHLSRCYWVINNYGNNINFTKLSSAIFKNTGNISNTDATSPSTFKLYKRNWNADGFTWGNTICSADAATAGLDGNVSFIQNNTITNFGQFVISNEGGTSYNTSINAVSNNNDILVSPTILYNTDVLYVSNKSNEKMQINIISLDGKILKNTSLQNNGSLSLGDISSGTYLYKITTSSHIQTGKLIILKK